MRKLGPETLNNVPQIIQYVLQGSSNFVFDSQSSALFLLLVILETDHGSLGDSDDSDLPLAAREHPLCVCVGAHSQCCGSGRCPDSDEPARLSSCFEGPLAGTAVSQERINTSQRQRQLKRAGSSQSGVPSLQAHADPETIKS